MHSILLWEAHKIMFLSITDRQTDIETRIVCASLLHETRRSEQISLLLAIYRLNSNFINLDATTISKLCEVIRLLKTWGSLAGMPRVASMNLYLYYNWSGLLLVHYVVLCRTRRFGASKLLLDSTVVQCLLHIPEVARPGSQSRSDLN